MSIRRKRRQRGKHKAFRREALAAWDILKRQDNPDKPMQASIFADIPKKYRHSICAV